jgi:hypothetical protein
MAAKHAGYNMFSVWLQDTGFGLKRLGVRMVAGMGNTMRTNKYLTLVSEALCYAE